MRTLFCGLAVVCAWLLPQAEAGGYLAYYPLRGDMADASGVPGRGDAARHGGASLHPDFVTVPLGSYVSYPKVDLHSRSFTMSMQVRPRPTGAVQYLFADWHGGYWQYVAALAPNGHVAMHLRRDMATSGSDPSQGLVSVGAPGVVFNEWNTLTWTWDRSTRTLSVYLGETLAASAVVRPAVTNLDLHDSVAPRWSIGRKEDSNRNALKADIREVAIYDGVVVPGACTPVLVGGSEVAGVPLAGTEGSMVGPSGLSLVDLSRLSWHQAGTDAHFPALPVPAMTTIELTCCNGPCHFWISVYHCPPCSAAHNGGLPGTLLGMGWDGGPCAPNFVEASVTYPMTTFHKALGAGESEVFDTTRPATHLVIYARDGAATLPWCPPRVGPFYAGGPACTSCLPAGPH